jgi:hypothetical protein
MFLSAVIDGRKDYARPAMLLADGKQAEAHHPENCS